MIPLDFISEWKRNAPWSRNDQVEQDLIICRALVEIFNHPVLAESLAFRGGTSLFKLYLPPVRYSEDIDLVQVHPGPIGPVMNALQEKLNPWLGKPRRKQSEGRITLTYRMESEEGMPLRLKMEINSREHMSVMGIVARKFEVQSRWFTGTASIPTYHLEELLGTKLRALYQRRKGRDLFDLWIAFAQMTVKPEYIVRCFLAYMEHEGHKLSRAEFEQNLLEKFEDTSFLDDIGPLLVTDREFDFSEAKELLMNRLLPFIPGEPWQGATRE
ncbi:MAG: nucleotidyl transferase AbiEii/AbiGii toxin family protein [Deltaproteobacteria bacterium]|nr:nucleotidyl transferase AbiEii/AbiGii toxin family protein [Deltaproteobacteria bacterium]